LVGRAGARLARAANHRLAAAPRRFVPSALVDEGRSFALADATALMDGLLMHKLPAEIAVLKRAAQLADDAYVAFRRAARPGRAQYELVADIQGYLRSPGRPGNFMILRSRGNAALALPPPPHRP